MQNVWASVAKLPSEIGRRVTVRGRVEPADVAAIMASGGIFLMTTLPGYEGYPCVIVEGMASGLVPVVTEGSDTGGLISSGATGYVTGRDPAEIAECIARTGTIRRDAVRKRVAHLGAPAVVGEMYGGRPHHE